MLPFRPHLRGFYLSSILTGVFFSIQPLAAIDFKGDFFDVSDREQVRQFYNTAYRSSDGVAAHWTGDVDSCHAGQVSDVYEAATLRRINWYRAFAGVPSNIVLDETYSSKARETALLLSANKTLTHFPTSDMRCYSAAGDEGAQKSNLTYGQAGAGSVKNQFEDHGNSNKSVGHRRWLLYPFTQKMGVGNVLPDSTYPRIGTVWVLDPPNLASWGAPRPETREAFVAWPPPGFIPYPLVYPRWSFTYPNADFSNAQVTLLRNGEAHPLMLEPYEVGAGENTLVWIPSPYKDGDRWQSVVEDEQYEVIIDGVRITGALQTFNYSVTIFDPLYSAQGEFSELMLPQGSEQLYRDDEIAFSVSGLSFADGYEWSVHNILESDVRYDAEVDDDLEALRSEGYSGYVLGIEALEGERSYHLAHPVPREQLLVFPQTFLVNSDSHIAFQSYLGWASNGQVASFEVSNNGGLSWIPLWEQAGIGSPQGQVVRQVRLPLSEYENQTLQMRFRYRFDGGSYYPQVSASVGWRLDSIELDKLDQLDLLINLQTNDSVLSNLDLQSSGIFWLQVRSQVFKDHFTEWGPGKRFELLADYREAPVDDEQVSRKKRKGLPVWLFHITP
ncbi:hypothetical protein DN062_02805 [Nitrincola tibetensis]|uniref:SCP domain-containing protein n=1 Tax=Nitrincola tibetensis TaxID=2219697 RepID=A0A364NQ56_9GAMM|nr:CAP domain-containing protein [Nitrincola tibetensis]RAU19216.1 hypothetical protein DN062_02805 [Nitrincola tibetensis]